MHVYLQPSDGTSVLRQCFRDTHERIRVHANGFSSLFCRVYLGFDSQLIRYSDNVRDVGVHIVCYKSAV